MSNDPVLPPVQVCPVVIGYVGAIHGGGGQDCPEFIPTVQELRYLAEAWLRRVYDMALEWFPYGSTGSYEIRIRPYAQGRLGRIADALGMEEMAVIKEQVEEEQERCIGKKLWDIFKNCSEEEWRARRAEINEELHRLEEPGQDPRRLPKPSGN
jgi:hypothetical protein